MYGKLLVCCVLLLSKQLHAIQFDSEIEDKFKKQLDFLINLGSKQLEKPEENGALKIYQQFQQDATGKTLNALLSLEHYGPVQTFCTELLAEVRKESTYDTYFKTAIEATKIAQEPAATQWNEFRNHVAHLLTDILKQKTNIQFNQDLFRLDKFLEMNKHLQAEGKDGVDLKAAVLVLFRIQQIQKDAVAQVLKNIEDKDAHNNS